ncbi:WD40 repeat-like protein [Exidia glandulosa HHB12029]|uniref:WD40 repeat-like protein n=1 Tax=Exidia glandulosa HHB12029 TaxID=1314781 RepID=A0A166A9M9_EXIGL|nr:WD40 repeat-like protein [Exidia glandulosa HHB12029]
MLSVRSISPAPAYESVIDWNSVARDSVQSGAPSPGGHDGRDTTSESRAPTYVSVVEVPMITDPFSDVNSISTRTAIVEDRDEVPLASQEHQDIRDQVRAATSESRHPPLNEAVLTIMSHTFKPNTMSVVIDELERRLKHPEDNNWCSLVKALTLVQILLYNGSTELVLQLRDLCDDLERLVVYPEDLEGGVDCGALVRIRAAETVSLLRRPSTVPQGLGQPSSIEPIVDAAQARHHLQVHHRTSDSPGCLDQIWVGPVISVVYMAGERQMIYLDTSGTLQLCDLATSFVTPIPSPGKAGEPCWIHCIAALPFGQCLVGGTLEQSLHSWDLDRNQSRTVRTSSPVRAVSVDQSGTFAVAATPDGILVWDMQSDDLPRLFPVSGNLTCISHSTQNNTFACGTSDGTVLAWNLASKELFAIGFIEERDRPGETPRDVVAVACGVDGKRVVAASSSSIAIWDYAQSHEGPKLTLLQPGTPPITDITISPAGTHIASSSGDGTIRVWDALTGEPKGVFQDSTSPVTSVCFSSDGLQVLSASSDHCIRIWDALIIDVV